MESTCCTASAVLTIFLCLCLARDVGACNNGNSIDTLSVTKDGQYVITCTDPKHHICHWDCEWTNLTCQEEAVKLNWKKEETNLVDMTFSSPIIEDSHIKPTNTGPKGVQRRCCAGPLIRPTKCQTFNWKPNPSTTETFNVTRFGMKTIGCKENATAIKDVKFLDKSRSVLSMEICCLESIPNTGVCVPRGHWTGIDTAAAIALGVSLPLALGLGIPALLSQSQPKDCLSNFNVIDGHYVGLCNGVNVAVDGVTLAECCALCLNGNYNGCYLNPFGTCSLCPGTVDDPGDAPGYYYLSPKG